MAKRLIHYHLLCRGKTARARTVRTRSPDGTTSGGAVNVVNEI